MTLTLDKSEGGQLSTRINNFVCICIVLPIGFCFMANPTYGQSTTEAMSKLLPPAEGAQLCYSRASDSGESSLSKLLFQIKYTDHPATDAGPATPSTYNFSLSLKLKNGGKILKASGECSDRDARAWCGVECDGGGFFLDQNPDASSLTVTFDPNDPRLRMGCEAESEPEMEFETRDQKINLKKVAPSVCEAGIAGGETQTN